MAIDQLVTFSSKSTATHKSCVQYAKAGRHHGYVEVHLSHPLVDIIATTPPPLVDRAGELLAPNASETLEAARSAAETGAAALPAPRLPCRTAAGAPAEMKAGRPVLLLPLLAPREPKKARATPLDDVPALAWVRGARRVNTHKSNSS